MYVLRKVLCKGEEVPIAINHRFKFNSYVENFIYNHKDTYEHCILMNTNSFVEYCLEDLETKDRLIVGWGYFKYNFLMHPLYGNEMNMRIPRYIVPKTLDNLCMLCNSVDNINLVLRMLWHGESSDSVDLSVVVSNIPVFKARYTKAMLVYKDYIMSTRVTLD